VLWTCFAANGTVHFLAACFVERASFALQSARFRNNAHVYSRQSARSKARRTASFVQTTSPKHTFGASYDLSLLLSQALDQTCSNSLTWTPDVNMLGTAIDVEDLETASHLMALMSQVNLEQNMWAVFRTLWRFLYTAILFRNMFCTNLSILYSSELLVFS
jgi:hypothetical protein